MFSDAGPEVAPAGQIEPVKTVAETQYTYTDILNNPEFKQQMQLAVKNNDGESAAQLQQKALEIARAADLPKVEIALLEGEKGLEFMRFMAIRQLFWQEFEDYYAQLKDISLLKKLYPEAQDLFERADSLVEKRDKELNDLAKSLAGDEDIAPYLEMVKQQWKDKASN